MDEVGDFMTTLRAFMEKAHRRATDLAKLTGISVRTIENWCAGVVQRPREITDVIKIGQALALNAADATTLLIAAGYDPLITLWTQAHRAGDTNLLGLLGVWSQELQRMEDSVNQFFSGAPIPPSTLAVAEQTALDRAANTAGMLWPAGIPDDRYYSLPGRERDLGILLDVLHDPHGAPVLVIDGLGGMGKTALAVELARRALRSGNFADIVGDSAKQDLFIGGDIVRIREATLDFDSLLDAIARQLGRWELPTLSIDEKRAALAQLLQRQRYLIVVDNLETAENAQALVAQLRGYLSNGRAIVTSREQVRHDFTRSLSLPGLTLEDSLYFLRADAALRGISQILDVSESHLAEIHTITGGAPLALKLVVAQAQFLDLELVLRRLRPAGSKLYPFIFQQSWEVLSLEAQRMLIYIGKAVVTTVGWEELRGVGIADSDDALAIAIDQLVAYSLLNRTTASGQMRYSIHQLTRQFIESDLPGLWQEQGLM